MQLLSLSLLFGEVELMETISNLTAVLLHKESLLFGEVELMETGYATCIEQESICVASLRRSGINGNPL